MLRSENPTRPATTATISSFEEFRARRRFGSLDGIRCICIVAVLWHHSPGLGEYLGIAGKRGFLGVDMFFVLSGFLISTLLIREREKYGRISLKAFWVRRSLRIFPIYYLLLFALAGAYAMKRGDPDADSFFAALPFNFFYLSNWTHDNGPGLGPLWSLATEEQFYLVWPLVEAFASRRARRTFLGIFLLANVLIAFRVGFGLLPQHTAEHLVSLEITQTTFLPIALGVLIAHAAHNPATFRVLRKFAGDPRASLFWLALLIGLWSTGPGDIQGGWRILLQTTMAIFVVSCVIPPRHILSHPLDARPIRSVGEVSYGMYLYHMWVIAVLLRVLEKVGVGEQTHPLAFFALMLVVTYTGSILSFHFIERPCLRFKKRFERVGVSRDEPRTP